MNYDLNGKKVLVIGLGRSGEAAARFAAVKGADVTISELKPEAAIKDFVKRLKDLPIKFSFGRNDPDLILNADLIILSPGIPLELNGLAKARSKKIPIIGELELAASSIKKPIIAVTGTNGKTTTTSLIGHILSSCGKKVCVGGNIGLALTDLIDKANNSDFVVVEVSSFQIETTPSLAPSIAVLLNITPDHLDRHFSFDRYADIKVSLFKNLADGGVGIYNSNDQAIVSRLGGINKRLIPFDTVKDSKGDHFKTNVEEYGSREWRFDNEKMIGAHNLENIISSVITAELCGLDFGGIQNALYSFKGLPHRVEFVGEKNGVSYYDDSKGTNVGATKAALESFNSRILLIAGGRDKEGDFKALSEIVKKRVRKMILIGEAKEKISRELSGLTEVAFADSMSEAVDIAAASAKKGEVVLLSPACASFDMFKDYAERGDVFKKEVKRVIR